MSPEEEMLPGEYDRPARKSGAVTAIAIINFVFGGLQVVCGLLLMVAGAFIGKLLGDVAAGAPPPQGMDPEAAKQIQQLGQAGGGMFAGFGALFGVCIMLFAIPTILAGVGVMNRRQWGRILTLVLGALAGLSALASLSALPKGIPNIVISGGYCVLVYVILLNKQYAAEFR